jgi:dipeptidyl aminopeptidase/acylaminoacyl peptidase
MYSTQEESVHRFRVVSAQKLGGNVIGLKRYCGCLGAVGLLSCALAGAQVTKAEDQRAAGLVKEFQGLTENVADVPSWVEDQDVLVYSKTVPGGHTFVVVDAVTGSKQPAFDHARIAAALNATEHGDYKAETLPFTQVEFAEHRTAIEFRIAYVPWRCDLSKYECAKKTDALHRPYHEDPNAERLERNSLDKAQTSPDKKWEAVVENYNVVVRSPDRKQRFVLSTDGSEGNFYELSSIKWSPDSTHLLAYRVQPGYRRMVHYIESSPATQLQPIYSEMEYTKPGDTLDLQQPVLFDVAGKREMALDNGLFPNPFELSTASWWKDSRGFTFEYNQRGHQVYRVIEVDAKTGKARTLIDEQSQTFIDYRPLVPSQTDTGKKFRHDLADGKEIIWMSERDGWAHLYLVDGATGRIKRQITKGEWVVRAVDRVDEAKGQIWFEASGMHPGEDPYFVHGYRINFDGTGLTPISEEPGDHRLVFSKDGKFYVDLVSTIDTPPVLTLYNTDGNVKVTELERGNIDKLKAAGWHAPEVFTAKGRDGKTDIWGVVWKPAHFDPQKKYPVIEDIYAGPQGSFVPKAFSTRTEPLAELGFVVVQIDGMGTNNRSKAFHDLAFKDLKDAGFPDRIAWHKAYAAQHPWYDISRVGIFGTSAGGQSAMGALLFHPEFYKVAVSNSGCHDNRMDKIWWNEQWMSWPIGPQYSESSNVDNAWRLQGKLMLVVGEMDSNVDPSSTFQVVDRLEKANKMFDLLFAPGENHGVRGPRGTYSQLKMQDFFLRDLLGQETPAWNEESVPPQPNPSM